MSSISIPNEVLPGFLVLLELNDEELNKVIKTISKIDVSSDMVTVSKDLSEFLGKKNAVNLLKTLISFNNLIELNEDGDVVDYAEIAKNLAESYIESSMSDSDQLLELENKLSKILSSYGSLEENINIRSSILRFDNTVRDLEVLTDIRPILDKGKKSGKKNAIITHKLIIEFSKDRFPKEMHFTLDLEDLMKLKNSIESAIENQEQLKNDSSKIFKFI